MRPVANSLGDALEVRATAAEVSESPIEAALLVALLTDNKHTRCELQLSGRGIVTGNYLTFFVNRPQVTALVVPQLRIGRHRVDLAVILEHAGRRVYAAVECDGQEFHSHADDVARDKSRDRALAANGWIVCRYPGSEIYRNGPACGVTVWEFLTTLAQVWTNPGNDLLVDIPGGLQ